MGIPIEQSTSYLGSLANPHHSFFDYGGNRVRALESRNCREIDTGRISSFDSCHGLDIWSFRLWICIVSNAFRLGCGSVWSAKNTYPRDPMVGYPHNCDERSSLPRISAL